METNGAQQMPHTVYQINIKEASAVNSLISNHPWYTKKGLLKGSGCWRENLELDMYYRYVYMYYISLWLAKSQAEGM